MNTDDPSTSRVAASHRHLTTNASECQRRNLSIRVDSVNADQTIAFCSVGQCERGLLRRTYSQPELVWRAEQALAPLIGLGLLPLINVRQKVTRRMSMEHNWWSPRQWISGLRVWLGYSGGRGDQVGLALGNDPFGLRKAMLPAAHQ